MSTRAFAVVLAVVVLTFSSFVAVVAPPAAARGVTSTAPPSLASGRASPSPLSPPPAGANDLSSRAPLARGLVRQLEAANVPMTAAYLPNLLGKVRVSNGVVQPLYSAAPAPMGIGDFGVRNTTGTAVGYVLESTSWQAVLSLNSSTALYLDSGVPDYFGVQLNTVLTNTTVAGHTTYSYWIQNVVQYSSATQSLRFLDNIWNFSNPSTAEPASTFFSGNGTPVDPMFYYDVYPAFNAAPLTVPFPFTVHLYENSSLTTDPVSHDVWSTVRFGYDILNGAGASLYRGIYDTVLFNSEVSTTDNPPTPKFMVNGTGPNPAGLLNDAELMIGGPGGGSTTTIYAINGTEQLQYLDGGTGRYTNAPSAWDEGTDTGETVEGLSETYRVAGTVPLSPGPSIPMPFWNATPGGNLGEALLQGTVNPSNSFLFFNQGNSFNLAQAAWGPVPPTGRYRYELPPGPYYVLTYASEYVPHVATPVLVNGANTLNVAMTFDASYGVYTPLWAWDNTQLGNLSSSGAGTATNPYVLLNNEYMPIVPLFGELNDFFFPVFSGIFIADTTAHVDINRPAPFDVRYPSPYAGALAFFGFPDTNELGIQVYNARYVSIWQGSFSGWFTGFAFSLPPFTPMANVAFWGVSNSLIGDSVFRDEGSALLVALGGNNVIWGNSIVPGPDQYSFYGYPMQLGIQEFESGDLIYNNLVTASIPALEFDVNFYTGAPQVNLDDWNLSAPAPASQTRTVNGYGLTGSIVGSPWQCGNSWGNYVPGSPLPYTDSGVVVPVIPPILLPPLMQSGGDYCPDPLPMYGVTFTETGLTSGTWSVALAGMTQSAAAGSPIAFQAPNGTWSYTVGGVPGRTVTPATGSVAVSGASRTVAITIAGALAASLGATPGATDVGIAVSFSAVASGGSGAYAYAWSFGDGAYAATQSASHAYPTAGTYTATLWVNDTSGGSVSQTSTVTVNALPTAAATASPSAVDVGQTVTFTGTANHGTSPLSLNWDFGDGSHTAGASPAHAFATPGTYHVTLFVTDAAGGTATGTATVTVSALPVASATASTNSPTAGDTVTFTGTSTGGSGIVTYAWSFGDGGSSSSQNPTHAYSASGTYTVTLWANDSSGGSSHTTLTIVASASSTGVISSTTGIIYAVIALIAGLVVGMLVMAVMRRRKDGEAPKAPPQPPST